jgi:2-amino-4-hydroxy-6-hydroxymethyldihydropteridine diphosphokinase
MNVAFLSLGGNMGDRLENLNSARQQISLVCGLVAQESGIYETEAWGHESDKKYLNQVIRIETGLNAFELIDQLQQIEKKIGRERFEKQFTDRIIDIDLLFFNNETINTAGLIVPHPRLHLRKFVLVPLADLGTDILHPVLNKKTSHLLTECEDPLGVKLFVNKFPDL